MKFKKAVSAFAALTMAISVFASLGVTANAAETFTYEVLYGTETKDGDTVTGVTAQTDFTGDANETTGYATAEANNNGSKIVIEGSVLTVPKTGLTKNFSSPITEGKVYFSANHACTTGTSGGIKIVDSNGTAIFTSAEYKSNNATLAFATICGTSISSYVRLPKGAFYGINEICIDLDARKVSYSLTASSGNGSVNPLSGEVALAAEITDVAGLSAKANYDFVMDSLSLYSKKSSATKYDYTINYKLDGVEAPVKTSSAKAEAGTVVTAESVFWADDIKYFITADTAPTLTVTAEGTNTINVPVRKANTYDVVVNAVGGTSKELVNASVVEGENYSYGFPMYIVDGSNIVYEAAANTDPYYGATLTNVNKDETVAITYTKKAENVVIYDDLDGSTAQNAGVRASNCSAYENTAYTSSASLEPGSYTIYVRYVNKGRGSKLTIGDQTIITSSSTDSGNWTTAQKDFVVTEAAQLKWNAGDNGTYDPIDTVLVVKKPVISAVSINSVGSTGATAVANLTEGYEVTAANTKADTATTFKTDGMTTTTVYIKVDNAVDNVMPTVTFGGVDYTPKYTYKANGGSYYVYQFIDTKGKDAVTKVTYPNAVDYTITAE